MKIFCFGDSNTYGYDPRSCLGSRYPAQSRWVDLLARNLNCTAVNAGENGREIPGREGEIRNFLQMLSLEKPIDLVIIMLGSNDLLQGNSPETAAKKMEALLNRTDLERSKILLIGPPPMQRGEWVPSQALTDASIALNHAYRALAERLGVKYADTGAWNIPLAYDGVHFTEDGHRVFAEKLSNYLNKGE